VQWGVEGVSVGCAAGRNPGLAAAAFNGAGGGPSACARAAGSLYSRQDPRRCVVVSARRYSLVRRLALSGVRAEDWCRTGQSTGSTASDWWRGRHDAWRDAQGALGRGRPGKARASGRRTDRRSRARPSALVQRRMAAPVRCGAGVALWSARARPTSWRAEPPLGSLFDRD
jgi:hypothetical protein